MVAAKWTVNINGTDYGYRKIHFEKRHPSPDPDTFTITLKGNQTPAYFSYVCIRRHGVIKFLGYLETYKHGHDEGGPVTLITGRGRKVLVWKKWIQRYIDTRLTGFFGNAYPHELIRFILRCPVSDLPAGSHVLDYPKQKIGWGISSIAWGTTANVSAVATDPAYPRMRLAGFYWRNRGTISNIASYVSTNATAPMQWTEVGGVGAACINTDDADASYIAESTTNDVSYKYHAANLPAPASGINSVRMFVKIKKVGGFFWNQYKVQLGLSNDGGGSWVDPYGYLQGANTIYQEIEFNITDYVNTVTEFNNMQFRFTLIWRGGIGAFTRITYVYFVVDYQTAGTQNVADYFRIDLGETYSRVCGIIIQSRYSSDQYARTYLVETSLDNAVWTTRATSPAGGNLAQDIIHSWDPIPVQFINIRITGADATHAWEITQIYVYEADDADYTITESTISPNLIVEDGNIEVKSASTDLLDPLNLPYSRMNDALNQICFAAYNASYEPYEWWIEDFNETLGRFHFGSRRGTDYSALGPSEVRVRFLDGVHINSSENKQSITKSAQRVKVIGKGSGRRQDEATSEWHVNAAAMGVANTFYEEIVSEKELSDWDTAEEWANVWLTKLKDPVQILKVIIDNDTYNPPIPQYDVGDTVYVRDLPNGITEQAARIYQYNVTVSEEGEIVTLGLYNAMDDINDRIANMYKQIRKLELSSTEVEEWTGEGRTQGKVAQDEMENYWEMKKKYDESNEITMVEQAANQTTYRANPANFSTVNVGQFIVAKDDMLFRGPSAVVALANPYIYIGDPATGLEKRYTRWSRDPRFVSRFVINSAFLGAGDYMLILIRNIGGTNAFGYQIEWDGASYELSAYKWDDGDGAPVTRLLGTIAVGDMYEIEAKVDWDDRLVFYKVQWPDGTIKQAVIALNDDAGDRNMTPLYIIAWLTGDGVGQADVEFYLWRSQGRKVAY